ncbi:MAG: hypothetical protein IPH18_06060 [Chitinophagaceae bacterium]|nr:hypothetical protein [Chitinophagaceae bacterium]
MKAILFLPLFLVFTEYNSMTSDSSHNLVSINKKFIAPDSRKLNLTDWSESLSDFRNALLRGDKATVKSYFDFPIENPGNDIWYVADTRFVSKMKPDKIVPFQESDFDTYYSAILPIDFRKTLENKHQEACEG